MDIQKIPVAEIKAAKYNPSLGRCRTESGRGFKYHAFSIGAYGGYLAKPRQYYKQQGKVA